MKNTNTEQLTPTVSIIIPAHNEEATLERCVASLENLNYPPDKLAFTDADCVVERDWLTNLIKQFDDEKIASVGGPNITPEDDTEFAKCAGEVLTFLSQTLGKFDQQPFRKSLTKNASPASQNPGPGYDFH